MKLLTKEQQELSENSKIGYICKKKSKINIRKIKNIVKLEIIAIIHSVFSLICNFSKWFFHNYMVANADKRHLLTKSFRKSEC